MKKRLVTFALAFTLAVGTVVAGIGCVVRYDTVAPGWYVPAYYEANGYPVVAVAPGVRAYYINGGWYTYHAGVRSWRPYAGRIVYRGRVYGPRVRVVAPRVRVVAPRVRGRVRIRVR